MDVLIAFIIGLVIGDLCGMFRIALLIASRDDRD